MRQRRLKDRPISSYNKDFPDDMKIEGMISIRDVSKTQVTRESVMIRQEPSDCVKEH